MKNLEFSHICYVTVCQIVEIPKCFTVLERNGAFGRKRSWDEKPE